MSLRLRLFPDPILHKKCGPISKITDSICRLSEQMIEVMLSNDAVGLSSPQIGRLICLIIIRDGKLQDGEWQMGPPEVLINPKLTRFSEEMESSAEGCLSFPGKVITVARPKSVFVQYLTLDGQKMSETARGFRARVIMHEHDHLRGVLFTDDGKINY